MATKPSAPAAAPAAAPADAPAKPKSKKRLIIIVGAVLVLLLAGAAVFFLMLQGGGADEEEEAQTDNAAPAAQAQAAPKLPPQFMALDPIVINLADPGVIRYAQVGITLQVDSTATADQVKAFLPTIRNGALRAISRRTSADLLGPEGKDKLAQDILELVRQETGLVGQANAASPVQAVLFSSLIVQ